MPIARGSLAFGHRKLNSLGSFGAAADAWLIMPKQTRDTIPALVLEVIAQVYELSGHRTQPWYIDRTALDSLHSTPADLIRALFRDGFRLLRQRRDSPRSGVKFYNLKYHHFQIGRVWGEYF